MRVAIRKATTEDIQMIQGIAKISWNDTYRGLIPEPIQAKFLEKAYSDDFMVKRLQQTLLMVAEVNSDMVGFANAFIDDNAAELSAIYLLPEAQGKGVGTKLLTAIINQLNVNEISVEVEKGNLVGEKFYEAKGFHVVKEYEDDLFGHTLQTKQMILKLR